MGMEFIATILVIVVLLQAAQNVYQAYVNKALQEEIEYVADILEKAAKGEIKLKSDGDM